MNQFKRKIIICLIIAGIIFANTLPLIKKAYSAETEITLETLSGGVFTIEYLGRSVDGLTWNYQVTEEEDSRDLSHWVLGLFECFVEENIIETTPEYSDFGIDPTTEAYGIKWDSSDVPGFQDDSIDSVHFSITFDQVYEEAEEGIQVAVKTGGNSHSGEDVKTAAGYITGPSCNVKNEEEEEENVCQAGPFWASEVIESNQGTLNNGNPINTDSEFTLNEQDGNFFSLGKGGELILSFENYIFDVEENSPEDIFGNGYDLALYEITWGRGGYPEETVAVSISQDGVDWIEIGTAGNHDNDNGISYFDIASVNLEWFKYVKITESTDFSLHGPDADGYDLDAVSAAYSCNQLLEIDPANLVLIKTAESQTVYPGEYLTYKLSYINIGEDPACNVRIIETVPENSTFEGLPGWICNPDTYPAQEGTECYYELGSLESGGEGQLIFTVRLNEEIQDTDQINNTAEITTTDDEEQLDDNTSTASTPLLLNNQGGGGEQEEDEQEEENEENSENNEEDDKNNEDGRSNEDSNNETNENEQNENTNNAASNQEEIAPIIVPIAQTVILNSDPNTNSVILGALNGSGEINDPEVLAATGEPVMILSSLSLLLLLLSGKNYLKSAYNFKLLKA